MSMKQDLCCRIYSLKVMNFCGTSGASYHFAVGDELCLWIMKEVETLVKSLSGGRDELSGRVFV